MKLKILLLIFAILIACKCEDDDLESKNEINSVETNLSFRDNNNVNYNEESLEITKNILNDEKQKTYDSFNPVSKNNENLIIPIPNNDETTTTTSPENETTETEELITTTEKPEIAKFSEGKDSTILTHKSTVTPTTRTETMTVSTTFDYEVCNITKLNHTFDNANYLTISWELNDNETCENSTLFIIVKKVSDGSNLTPQASINALTFSYKFNETLIPCAIYNYSVALFGNNNAQWYAEEITSNEQYTKVENLTAIDIEDYNNTGKLNTNISWNYEYKECNDTIFVVLITPVDEPLDFPRYIEKKTSHNQIIFDNLPACLNFNITVYPEQDNSSKVSIDFKTQRVNPTEIMEFNASQDSSLFEIDFTWTHPEYGAYCIKNYIIEYKSESHTNSTIIDSTLKSYMLKNAISCSQYFVILSTISTDEITTPTEEKTETTEEFTESTIISTSIMPAFELEVSTCHSFNVIEQSITLNYTTLPRRFVQRPRSPNLIYATETTLTLDTDIDEPNNKCSADFYSFTCRNGEKNYTKESVTNIATIEGLEAYTSYNCTSRVKNNLTEWSELESYETVNLRTTEGTPNPPYFRIVDDSKTKDGFNITWLPPTAPKGKIKSYTIYIKFANFNYFNPHYCNKSFEREFYEEIQEDKSEFTFKSGEPSSKYYIQMKAANGAKESEYSEIIEGSTSNVQSDAVRDFKITPNEVKVDDKEYNKLTKFDWFYPCQANGQIYSFSIRFSSSKEDFLENINYIENQSEYHFEYDELEPDIEYSVQIYAITEFGTGKDTILSYKLESGFPQADIKEELMPKITATSTISAKLKISDEIFESNVGKITKIALLIAELYCGNDIEQQKDYLVNDESKEMTYKKAIQYDCIPQYHSNIILEQSDEEVTIGTDSCEGQNGLCNGYLKPGTSYAVTFRIYTDTGFSDTKYIEIKTHKDVPVFLISITVLSLLCVVFFIGFYISYKRTRELRNTVIDSYDRKDIAIQNFPAYYKEMLMNENEKIKEEYRAIQFFSENLDKTCIASKANEKLNRYANISPYDYNRVVLNDDEFENDYINASYVNGYYHSKEYIAAQGPKPSTAFDFWRMVLQHKCESIVMLTSLVENNKVKCHEYFPKLNGRVKFDNIQVICVEEQKHANYVRRVLEIEKSDVKLRVKHYFFSKWPDHSTPSNPNALLELIKIVRNERERPDNTFIVHCSAGVGRTGTFIALDIMMQRIKKEAKINIFDLVKQLRLQRMKMVQTIDQYSFLYNSAFELTNKRRQPNVLQNFVNMFEEFELVKKLRNNLRESNENIIKKEDSESAL